MANYSRWDDIKRKRRDPDADQCSARVTGIAHA